MTKLKTIVAIGLWLALTPWQANLSAQTTAHVLIDSSQISIGDQVKLVFRVAYSKNGLFQRADFSQLDSLEGIEVLAVDTPRTRISNIAAFTEQTLMITSFDAGRYELPAIPIYVAEGAGIDTAWTKELVLEVRDVVVNRDSLHIEPIKDIIPEPQRLTDYWPYFAGVFLLLLIWGLWRYANRPVKERAFPKMVVKKTPDQIALDKLYALQRGAPWLHAGATKAYYADLTFIAREYLENRYGIKALESTTREILTALKKEDLTEAAVSILRDLLQTADLVKFAKANPDAATGAEWLERAIELVKMTGSRAEESTIEPSNTPIDE